MPSTMKKAPKKAAAKKPATMATKKTKSAKDCW